MIACARCGKLIPGQFTQTEEVICRECADWLSAHLYGSISFTLKEPLTDQQIDALFPLDQLGDDPRWVEAINKMKETNRRARGDA